MAKDNRSRLFAFLVYPDSVNTPENWLDLVSQFHVPALVSPRHIDGYDPEGFGKKPHYHIMMCFEGNKSDDQVIALRDIVGGVGLLKINSKVQYARYLCHLDETDKIKYDPNDVRSFGIDYLSLIESPNDIDVYFCEIEDFIDKYNIVSFFALSRYCSKHNKNWSRILRHSGAVYFREYLKSKKWSDDNNCSVIIDPESGEVIE